MRFDEDDYYSDSYEDDSYYTSGYQGKTYEDHKRKPVELTKIHLRFTLIGLAICAAYYFGLNAPQSNLLHYMFAINITTFILYAYDKYVAVNGTSMRVPEAVLHLGELMGGSIAGIFARNILNHKKRKVPFWTISWMIIVIHLFIFYFPVYMELGLQFQIIMGLLVFALLISLFFFNEAFDMLVWTLYLGVVAVKYVAIVAGLGVVFYVVYIIIK